MTFRTALRYGAALTGLFLLAACGSYTQTRSGRAYLDRYAEQAATVGGSPMEANIRAAADVEPTLTFPARIGIARIDDGRLSPVPGPEAEAWLAMAERLGPDWGEFVPISPLVAALVSQPGAQDKAGWARCAYSDCIDRTVKDVRLAAARQHVDAVLIYEVFGKGGATSNPLAVTKLALIGFFVAPSENVEADGFGHALLLDVRNGYTYGFATAVAEDAAFSLATSVNEHAALQSALDEAETAAAIELAKEVEIMARDLRLELAEMRAAQAGAAARQQ